MKVSAKAEYACLAVLALARQGPEAPPLRIREISEEYGIPERYLVQILLQLKGAGLVASTRGALGGYRLARPASSISLSEILDVIDGPDTTALDRICFIAVSNFSSSSPFISVVFVIADLIA